MSVLHPPSAFIAPDVSELSPLFPGYEIQSLIATGGMGAVYLAVQKSLDRMVAIKILPQVFSKDASFCASFEAEAKAMARLNHPNLIGVYDFGEVNGMLFIIMEYVPGQSLFHSAHGIAIDPGEVIRLVSSICSGLAHAHENGIVHRDIKPSNILLDLSAQPKIGDFGLARPVERKDQEGEEIFGTPHYTAPEVIHSPESVGYRADIFSVGVLLHELLTGKLPADDPRPASVICRCDLRFDAIIRRATNPQPELRYANAAEIIKDLQNISLPTGPKIVQRTGPQAPVRPTSARRAVSAKPKAESSGTASIVWILVLAGLAIFLYFYFNDNKPVIIETVPVKPNAEIPPPPKEEPLTPAPEPEPVTPPEPAPPPAPEPEVQPIMPAEPEPAPPAEMPLAPKLDVDGFFARARKIMSERVPPLVAERDKELDKNVDAMKRLLNRHVRKIEYPAYQKRYDVLVEAYTDSCKANGNRIPPVFPSNLAVVPEFVLVHKEYYDKEQPIDETLITEVSKLSATYRLGLQKQIERSKQENDTPAVLLLEEEIANVGNDPLYFPKLMLGEDKALLPYEPASVEETLFPGRRNAPF